MAPAARSLRRTFGTRAWPICGGADVVVYLVANRPRLGRHLQLAEVLEIVVEAVVLPCPRDCGSEAKSLRTAQLEAFVLHIAAIVPVFELLKRDTAVAVVVHRVDANWHKAHFPQFPGRELATWRRVLRGDGDLHQDRTSLVAGALQTRRMNRRGPASERLSLQPEGQHEDPLHRARDQDLGAPNGKGEEHDQDRDSAHAQLLHE